MRPRRRRIARQRRKARALAALWDRAPYVCPGCFAVGIEPHAPGCIDAEIEIERERYTTDECPFCDFGCDECDPRLATGERA